MALTFFSALFIPLQYTIFLGAALSLLLYVVASARKLRLQEAAHLDDGGWEMREPPKELTPGRATVFVVQGLDFFAEVPTLADEIPPARGVSGAVVILIARDMQTITSTGIRWIERYAKELRENGSLFMLADVNPPVLDTLRKSGAMESIGEENVFPATARVLEAERTAWNAAQMWLEAKAPTGEAVLSKADDES
jgi:SulP family sulfate permease